MPKIIIIHNDILKQILNTSSEVLWSKFPKLYLLFEKTLISSFDKIFSVSKNTIDYYKEKHRRYSNRLSFIPTWVDSEEFALKEEDSAIDIKGKVSAKYSIPFNRKWILFVGRLQDQKGPLRLIDLYYEYYKYNKLSFLIIIGEGNLENKVRQYIKKNSLQNHVKLLGSLKQKDLCFFYRCSDVMVVTSQFEGMPMSVLEALACGLPVVSTSVGEIKRVVINRFSGEVVEGFNPKEMAEKVKLILSEPQNYSKKNCANSVRMFSPEKVLSRLYETIKILYDVK